jgi:hypothetical protein
MKKLYYIHIGKCGGTTLWRQIQSNKNFITKYDKIERIHIRKPPIDRTADYIIVIRNPTSRALSAFNWRYFLVVEDGCQRNRFPGEYSVLRRYGNLNNLAEKLFTNDVLNTQVASDFECIHHLKENIHFYLGKIMKNIYDHQVLTVFAQESLDHDISTYLNVGNSLAENRFANQVPSYKLNLSTAAAHNLKRYLKKDYECIEELMKIRPTPHAPIEVLLRQMSLATCAITKGAKFLLSVTATYN